MKLNRKKRGELFEKFKPLCSKKAFAFAQTYALSYQEVFDEAQSILGETLAGWNSAGRCDEPGFSGKPITWIYSQIHFRLLDYCTRNRPKYKVLSALEKDEQPIALPAPRNRLAELLKTIGEDARMIVGIITMAPAEIADELSHNAPKRSTRAVQQYLRENKGWDEDRLQRAWFEVECAL